MTVFTGIVMGCSAQGATALTGFVAPCDARVHDTVIPTVCGNAWKAVRHGKWQEVW